MLSCREGRLGRAGPGAAPRGSLAEGNLIFMNCSCLNPKSSAPVTRSCVTLRSHGNCCYFQDPSLAEWHKSSFPFSCLSFYFFFFFLFSSFPSRFPFFLSLFEGGLFLPVGFPAEHRAAFGDAGAAALTRGGQEPPSVRVPPPKPAPLPGSGSGRCSP